MTTETALPTGAESAAAGEQASTQAAAATETTLQQPTEGQQGAEAAAEGEGEGGDKPAKKEKTAEQREIERLRRRVDNLTRQKYELSARQPQDTQPAQRQQQASQASTDEPVTLTRAQLDQMIAERANELAPAVKEQQAEAERRNGVLSKLAKDWGKEEFDAKASELDDAFGGLADRSGRPKPATDAIFDADDPKAVIEYLTDPDNADEAERISRLSATQAGRAIARIELKLEEARKAAKPKPSNAARPIESVKGGGVPNGMPDPADTKAYMKWANEQERSARR